MSDRPEVSTPLLAHQPGLDGLRTLAIFGVMASHAKLGVFKLGWIGVDVFFVLSGFLITTLLLREKDGRGGINWRAFVVRRAARLLPALALLLAILSLWALVDRASLPGITRDTVVGIPVSALYVGAWVLAFDWHGLGALSHTWSLSVEEHFYVAWPMFVAYASRVRDRRTKWIVGAYVVAVAYRLAAVAVTHADFERLYFGPDTRAEQLLAGCALAALLAARPSQGRDVRWLGVVGVVSTLSLVAMAAGVASSIYPSAGMSAAALLGAITVAAVFLLPQSPLARTLSTRPMVWFGRRSYGMYLWYWPVTLVMAETRLSPWPRFTVVVLVTSGIAAASYRVLELPVIAWGRARSAAIAARAALPLVDVPRGRARTVR